MSTSTADSVSCASARRPRPRSPPSMYIAYEMVAAKPPKPLLKLPKNPPKGKGKASDPTPASNPVPIRTDPALAPPPVTGLKPRSSLVLRLSLRRKPASDTVLRRNSQYSMLDAVDQRRPPVETTSTKARRLFGTTRAPSTDSRGTSEVSFWRTSMMFSSGHQFRYGRHGLGPSVSDSSLAATSFDECLADDSYVRHGQAKDDDGMLKPMEFTSSSRGTSMMSGYQSRYRRSSLDTTSFRVGLAGDKDGQSTGDAAPFLGSLQLAPSSRRASFVTSTEDDGTRDAEQDLAPVEFAPLWGGASNTSLNLANASDDGETDDDTFNSPPSSRPATPETPRNDSTLAPAPVSVPGHKFLPAVQGSSSSPPSDDVSFSNHAVAPSRSIIRARAGHTRDRSNSGSQSLQIRAEKNERGWGWTGEWNRGDIDAVRDKLRSLK